MAARELSGDGKGLWLRSRDANRRLEVLVDDLPQTVWRPVPMARYAPHVHIVWREQGGDQTLLALAGLLSRRGLERYSHARNESKRAAVKMLDIPTGQNDSPQFPPQSAEEVGTEIM
jgi:hypothetical protein